MVRSRYPSARYYIYTNGNLKLLGREQLNGDDSFDQENYISKPKKVFNSTSLDFNNCYSEEPKRRIIPHTSSLENSHISNSYRRSSSVDRDHPEAAKCSQHKTENDKEKTNSDLTRQLKEDKNKSSLAPELEHMHDNCSTYSNDAQSINEREVALPLILSSCVTNPSHKTFTDLSELNSSDISTQYDSDIAFMDEDFPSNCSTDSDEETYDLSKHIEKIIESIQTYDGTRVYSTILEEPEDDITPEKEISASANVFLTKAVDKKNTMGKNGIKSISAEDKKQQIASPIGENLNRRENTLYVTDQERGVSDHLDEFFDDNYLEKDIDRVIGYIPLPTNGKPISAIYMQDKEKFNADSCTVSENEWRLSGNSCVTGDSTLTDSNDTLAHNMSELSSVNSYLSDIDFAFDELDRIPPLELNKPEISDKTEIDKVIHPNITDAISHLEDIEIAAKNLLTRHKSKDSEIKDICNEVEDCLPATMPTKSKIESYNKENIPNVLDPSVEKKSVTKKRKKTQDKKKSKGSKKHSINADNEQNIYWLKPKDLPPFISRESYNEDLKTCSKLRESYKEKDLNDFLDQLENTAWNDTDEEFVSQLLEDLEENEKLKEVNLERALVKSKHPAEISQDNISQASKDSDKLEKIKDRVVEILKVKRKQKVPDCEENHFLANRTDMKPDLISEIHVKKENTFQNQIPPDKETSCQESSRPKHKVKRKAKGKKPKTAKVNSEKSLEIVNTEESAQPQDIHSNKDLKTKKKQFIDDYHEKTSKVQTEENSSEIYSEFPKKNLASFSIEKSPKSSKQLESTIVKSPHASDNENSTIMLVSCEAVLNSVPRKKIKESDPDNHAILDDFLNNYSEDSIVESNKELPNHNTSNEYDLHDSSNCDPIPPEIIHDYYQELEYCPYPYYDTQDGFNSTAIYPGPLPSILEAPSDDYSTPQTPDQNFFLNRQVMFIKYEKDKNIVPVSHAESNKLGISIENEQLKAIEEKREKSNNLQKVIEKTDKLNSEVSGSCTIKSTDSNIISDHSSELEILTLDIEKQSHKNVSPKIERKKYTNDKISLKFKSNATHKKEKSESENKTNKKLTMNETHNFVQYMELKTSKNDEKPKNSNQISDFDIYPLSSDQEDYYNHCTKLIPSSSASNLKDNSSLNCLNLSLEDIYKCKNEIGIIVKTDNEELPTVSKIAKGETMVLTNNIKNSENKTMIKNTESIEDILRHSIGTSLNIIIDKTTGNEKLDELCFYSSEILKIAQKMENDQNKNINKDKDQLLFYNEDVSQNQGSFHSNSKEQNSINQFFESTRPTVKNPINLSEKQGLDEMSIKHIEAALKNKKPPSLKKSRQQINKESKERLNKEYLQHSRKMPVGVVKELKTVLQDGLKKEMLEDINRKFDLALIEAGLNESSLLNEIEQILGYDVRTPLSESDVEKDFSKIRTQYMDSPKLTDTQNLTFKSNNSKETVHSKKSEIITDTTYKQPAIKPYISPPIDAYYETTFSTTEDEEPVKSQVIVEHINKDKSSDNLSLKFEKNISSFKSTDSSINMPIYSQIKPKSYKPKAPTPFKSASVDNSEYSLSNKTSFPSRITATPPVSTSSTPFQNELNQTTPCLLVTQPEKNLPSQPILSPTMASISVISPVQNSQSMKVPLKQMSLDLDKTTSNQSEHTFTSQKQQFNALKTKFETQPSSPPPLLSNKIPTPFTASIKRSHSLASMTQETKSVPAQEIPSPLLQHIPSTIEGHRSPEPPARPTPPRFEEEAEPPAVPPAPLYSNIKFIGSLPKKITTRSGGVWTPGAQSEHSVSRLESPDLPSFKDVPTVWIPARGGSASPSAAKKEYRKISFDGPTVPKRNFQETNPGPRPEESFAWKDREAEITLPRVQSPTVTLLQKKREGQINDHKPDYLKGDDTGFFKPGDKLYTIKKEYESEDEEHGSRKFAILGHKKIEGVGPTTRDGIPVSLKTGVKSEHQGEWYKRMFDSLHKVKDVRYGGYMSEPDGYDSDAGITRYGRFDRSKNEFEVEQTDNTLSRDSFYYDLFDWKTKRYVHQPGRIENYVPGFSSLSERELRENPEADVKLEISAPSGRPSKETFQGGKKSAYNVFKDGYESDSTLVFKKREENRLNIPDPRKSREIYRQIQKGGDIPLSGLQRPAPRNKVPSSNKYETSEVNIHYRTPIRVERKEAVSDEELARRQEEHMQKVYELERRKKYLQELEDIERRRHTDNFTPLQKSPIPLNRYDDESYGYSGRNFKTPDPPRQLAKALFGFQAQNKRELSFNKGDTILIRRQIDKNWLEGEFRGTIGIFPANYVEVQPLKNLESLGKRPTEGQAKVKFNFQAQTTMEMSLNKGEFVLLTRRVDGNWYEGRIGQRKGIFPVSYVEVLSQPINGTTSPSTETMSRPALPPAHLLYNGTSSANSPYSTLGYHGNHSDTKAPYSQLTVSTQQEPIAYRALYNYKPQNDDELELLEGDVVMVMEKCDDGWFVGTSQRTNLFGTFPGNYVEKI